MPTTPQRGWGGVGGIGGERYIYIYIPLPECPGLYGLYPCGFVWDQWSLWDSQMRVGWAHEAWEGPGGTGTRPVAMGDLAQQKHVLETKNYAPYDSVRLIRDSP
jgi:hypothetical protein